MLPRRPDQERSSPLKSRGKDFVGQTERPSPREDFARNEPSDRSTETRPTSGVNRSAARATTRDGNVAPLWLRRSDQFLLGFLLIALLTLLTVFRWKLSGGGREEIEIVSQQSREYYYSIDINRASWVEWAQLDGIGEKLARRIVQDRDEQGSFRSIDDLRRVRGLGPKLVEKLRPFLKCSRAQPQESDQGSN
jgi:competence protein ComEA